MTKKKTVKKPKPPCTKCKRIDYVDQRCGLCDRCAFPDSTRRKNAEREAQDSWKRMLAQNPVVLP